MTERVLLKNGYFYQGSGSQTLLQSALVEDGVISALAFPEEFSSGLRRSCRQIDLQGQTVWPGLVDSHLHLAFLAEQLAAVDCETGSLAECLARVEAKSRGLSQGEWVIGYGWNQNAWEPANYGTAAELEQVSVGHPAVLYAKSLHASWANETALRAAGIDISSADPAGGRILRDSQGKPTGILLENAVQLVDAVVPPLAGKRLESMLKHAQALLLSYGLTSVHDFDRWDCFQALLALDAAGELLLRVRKNLHAERLADIAAEGLRSGSGTEHLFLGSLKYFADGALGPQTAAMLSPYENSDSAGILLMDADEVYAQGLNAAAVGFPLAIHAIGDLAVRAVLDGYQRLRAWERENGRPPLPHRIEHVQLITPEDQPRLKALDVIASMQPIHAPSDMFTADQHWGSRSVNAYAFSALLKQGTQLIFGSDAPVESANPFLGLHAAVTRRRVSGEPGAQGWYPEQRISLAQALDAYTGNPARSCGLGQSFGRIASGYRADLIVLPRDPFRMNPQDLWQLAPEMTLVDGRVVFQR